MKFCRLAAPLVLAICLAGCAGSVSEPVPVQPLASDVKANLHVSEVSVEAEPGVALASYEAERIVEKVKAQLNAGRPGVFVGPSFAGSPSVVKMKLLVTRYDKGNAFARAMLAGLGQIHIDAQVLLVDQAGTTVAQYQISKDFAFGGVYGASTHIEDVEDGFAKSVVEIFVQKRA